MNNLVDSSRHDNLASDIYDRARAAAPATNTQPGSSAAPERELAA